MIKEYHEQLHSINYCTKKETILKVKKAIRVEDIRRIYFFANTCEVFMKGAFHALELDKVTFDNETGEQILKDWIELERSYELERLRPA